MPGNHSTHRLPAGLLVVLLLVGLVPAVSAENIPLEYITSDNYVGTYGSAQSNYYTITAISIYDVTEFQGLQYVCLKTTSIS